MRYRRLLPDYRGIFITTLLILACIEWGLIYLHAYYPKEVHFIVNEVCNHLGIDQ